MAIPTAPDGGGYFDTSSTSTPAATGGSSYFRVDESTVLQAHQLVQQTATQLGDQIEALAPNLRIERFGGDPVSTEAVPAFNHRLSESPDSYLERARTYQNNLQVGAEALRAAALTYGYTEDDIARGFPPGASGA